jgi:hypothetical protein
MPAGAISPVEGSAIGFAFPVSELLLTLPRPLHVVANEKFGFPAFVTVDSGAHAKAWTCDNRPPPSHVGKFAVAEIVKQVSAADRSDIDIVVVVVVIVIAERRAKPVHINGKSGLPGKVGKRRSEMKIRFQKGQLAIGISGINVLDHALAPGMAIVERGREMTRDLVVRA